MWRTKTLALGEWTALQQQFEVMQLAVGAPEHLAMFAKSDPGETGAQIFITGPGINVIEAASPGGWVDSGPPSGGGVSLLVGSGDPWTYFGIHQA